MLVYKKESPEAIRSQADFILTCQTITSDIIALPNCPWSNNNDPIRYWISNGQYHLGKIQMDIIKFLHQNYFKYGRPVYLKARNIAARMGLTSNAVVKAISKLVDRGVLVRMHFMMDSNNRSMILPGTKEFNEFRRENINSGLCIPPSTDMFCKLPKPLQESKSLYSILLYFKQMYLNLKVSLQKKVNYVPLRGCDAPSDGKLTLIERLKERIKQKTPALPPAPPSADNLKTLLKKHNFDITKLPIKDQNDVAALVDHRLMVDMRYYMKGLKVTQSPYMVNASREVLRMICWLFCFDHNLDAPLLDRVMAQWNSMAVGHPRVTAHTKTSKESKSYNTRLVITTYNKCKRGEEFITRGIRRFFENGWDHKQAYFTDKKICFEDIFLNPFDKQLWATMLNASDRDWEIYVHNDGFTVRHHREEIDKAKQFLIHVFFTDHPERGKDFMRMHERTYCSWVIKLINSFNLYKRHTGGLGLIFHKDDAHPSVLFEYLMWYNTNRAFDGINIVDLTSKDYWGRFISHMQIEWNDNFWKREANIVEE